MPSHAGWSGDRVLSCYLDLDFNIVCASEVSASDCFRISSHCLGACALDSSTISATVVVPANSRAYFRVVITFAFINSIASARNSAAARKLLLITKEQWTQGVGT